MPPEHVKVYLKYFNLGEQDIIECEICGKQGRIDRGGFDIHHLNGRGKGKDVIENLQCLCRKHHTYANEGKIDKTVFIERHKMFLKR
jgi:hypothetical protein